jgi:hypothetical protein
MSSSGRSPSSDRLTPYSESDPLHFKRASMPCQDELLVCCVGATSNGLRWCLCGELEISSVCYCGPESGIENLTICAVLISGGGRCEAEFSWLVVVATVVHQLGHLATCPAPSSITYQSEIKHSEIKHVSEL